MSDIQTLTLEQDHASGNRLLDVLRKDRVARWTSRLVLLLLWQLAGLLSDRFPTPVETIEILVLEFQTPFDRGEWSFINNELVANLLISINRTGIALIFIILIGVPVGYAMGRWWRVQAYFTDLVTVGLAMPAYMWALLAVMWFGFGLRAPVFCAVVSATPGLIVHVLQGSLSIPRDLRDMSDAFDVPGPTRMRNLALPSMAGALIAGIRLSIIAAWGCVVLVEWFGSNEGAGFRARDWYQSAANYNGLMAWGIVVLVVVILVDRGIIERIDKAVHKWRGSVGDFGAKTVELTAIEEG
ncbi:MAG TPA: ABC transporter permease subunit [Acidimicrobiia bacterium]|nr:ABC transporter permease subunit [Acidimicrobiia bacterium]